jgi:hypothetical protein
VTKGHTKFTSPQREEHSLLMVEQTLVGFAKMRGGLGVISEGEVEVLVEGFSFLVKPIVYGVGSKGGIMVVLSTGVGVRIKGCLL